MKHLFDLGPGWRTSTLLLLELFSHSVNHSPDDYLENRGVIAAYNFKLECTQDGVIEKYSYKHFVNPGWTPISASGIKTAESLLSWWPTFLKAPPQFIATVANRMTGIDIRETRFYEKGEEMREEPIAILSKDKKTITLFIKNKHRLSAPARTSWTTLFLHGMPWIYQEMQIEANCKEAVATTKVSKFPTSSLSIGGKVVQTQPQGDIVGFIKSGGLSDPGDMKVFVDFLATLSRDYAGNAQKGAEWQISSIKPEECTERKDYENEWPKTLDINPLIANPIKVYDDGTGVLGTVQNAFSSVVSGMQYYLSIPQSTHDEYLNALERSRTQVVPVDTNAPPGYQCANQWVGENYFAMRKLGIELHNTNFYSYIFRSSACADYCGNFGFGGKFCSDNREAIFGSMVQQCAPVCSVRQTMSAMRVCMSYCCGNENSCSSAAWKTYLSKPSSILK